jgi:tetratricopeptide (TPR) repeat protein
MGRMRRTAWILALILLPTGSPGAIADANQRGINELLDSAQLWQARSRPDLARSLLQKVLAVRADDPRALLLLGEIDLRSGRKNAALSQLAMLQARHPDSNELRELQLLASLYNNDSLRLNRLQQLREAGRTAEAAVLARQIFPSARPPGLLGADLAGLIASTPGAWEISRRQAEERVAASGSAVNRLALAEVLAQRPGTRARAWQTYNLLAREAQLPSETVAASWRRSIRMQPEGTAVGPLWAALHKAIDGPGTATATAGTRSNGAINGANNGAALISAINAMNEGGIDAPAAGQRTAERTAERISSALAAASTPDAAPAPPPLSARDKAVRQVLDDAQVLLATGANEQAAKRLEASLVRHGDDGPTWGLLGLSRMREGQHAEAEPAFERALRLDPGDAERWRALGVAAHYWAAVSLARIEADVGRTEVAADLLRPVIDSQPKAIEAKLLLARLEGEMGQHEAALGHFEQVLVLEPKEERAWRGRFNVRLITDPEAAIAELAAVGPEAAEILDSGAVRDLADVRMAQGSTSAALRLLEQAIEVSPAEPWLRHDAARLYLQLGLPDSARTLMAEGRAAASADTAVTMQQASALVALAGDENDLAVELVSVLPEAEARGPLRPLVQRAHLEQAFSNARQAIDAQRPSSAQVWLDKADRLIDSSVAQGMRLARLRLGAGQRPQALVLLRRIDPIELDAADTLTWATMVVDAGASDLALDRLQERIDANTQAQRDTRAAMADVDTATEIDPETRPPLPVWSAAELIRARFAHAELAIEAGLPQAARLDLQTLAASLPADALDERLRLLSLQRRIGETAAARATLAELMLRSGDEPAVRIAAARQARSDDDDVGALGHLQVARERSAPGSDSAAEAARALDAIDAVRQPLLEVALHDASLDGSQGRAHLQSSEATARLSWPGLGNGTLFTQVDLIRLDAGTLPAALAQSEAFGRVLAQNPAGLAAPSAQNDRGAAFGVGWTSRNNDVDIGVVGLRLRNWVGGWSHTRRRDDGGWNVELSRRVLTSSLLSWAGARDPSDGAIWGGVTLNALTLRSEHVLSEADSAALSLRLGVLQGREVASNQMLQLRGTLDHDLQSSADRRLRIGLNANVWHYARNLSFHTFGQGGYYSPQRYLSIGVPIEAAGMNGALSYQVRASLSHSWTREDDTPYYPTDAAAQAAAGNPIHTGGPGGGLGASLRAALEWRIAPQWALGGALSLERSTDYTPARASLYLRHWLGRVPAPLDWPPQPLTPYLRN